MGQTIEQKRAENAWQASKDYGSEHVNIAKSLPALIMNSGLMQVMAFAHSKGGAHRVVITDLYRWLSIRFGARGEPSFEEFMQALLTAKPQHYQMMNAEAFAWLKWLRQMSSARLKGDS